MVVLPDTRSYVAWSGEEVFEKKTTWIVEKKDEFVESFYKKLLTNPPVN